MKNLTRRQFIEKTALGSLGAASLLSAKTNSDILAPIKLGDSGIKTTRIAMGTGTSGSNKSSKQTRLGMEKFIDLIHHGYDSGVRFFEGADSYGSHSYLKEAIKELPREEITLLSKLWCRPADWANFTTAKDAVDRFRKELGTDYIDIVLMHCMVEPDWPERYKKVCDDLFELREKGIIGSFGVSCHSFPALIQAVETDWTEIIFARINPFGSYTDHYPENVVKVLKEARRRGKGVVGMKIYGGNKNKAEDERQQSLEYVWKSQCVDAITIGFSEPEHIDDTLNRMRGIL